MYKILTRLNHLVKTNILPKKGNFTQSFEREHIDFMSAIDNRQQMQLHHLVKGAPSTTPYCVNSFFLRKNDHRFLKLDNPWSINRLGLKVFVWDPRETLNVSGKI